MARGLVKRGEKWWISYAGIDGKIIRESSGSEKFKDAEALLLNRKKEVLAGKQPGIQRIASHTLTELATPYLKWAERQKSYCTKKYIIQTLCRNFGHLALRKINSMMLEQYQTQPLKQGNKPATVNRQLATLSHMFTKAVEWRMVEKDILEQIRKVKLLPENNRRLRYLLAEECQNLIMACEPHLKPIVITALNTGMRKSEILSLKWENIDLKNGFILLGQHLTKNSERREIPINDTLRAALTILERRLDIPYLFYDLTTGKRFMDVKISFQTALRRAGIRDFHFHDLRHTFASRLVMAGVDLVTVKELLGHKSFNMTLRYAHLAPGHKVQAVKALDEGFHPSFEIQNSKHTRPSIS